MEYTTLGKTGLKISRMGFGGIPIQRIDAEGTKKLMQQLAEEGVNYIDTARGYTVSEEYLGYALEGTRDKFVIATKSMARTREAMAADIEKSLGNLRTNHIDLYQVHNPSMEQLDTVIGEDGALEALLEAKAAGKIGHIGLTAHSTAVFERALNLDWVEAQGGAQAMEQRKWQRANMLYDTLDSSKLFRCHAQKGSRSGMNVTFRTGDAELDAKFVAEATQAETVTGEHPVMLLDDVLSELDDGRKQYLLTRMREKQTFVTSCDDTAFLKTDGEVYRMNGGVLTKA